MSLIQTSAGVFNPKKLVYMSPIRMKRDGSEHFFTVTIEGVTDTIFVTGTEEEVKVKWSDIVKNMNS